MSTPEEAFERFTHLRSLLRYLHCAGEMEVCAWLEGGRTANDLKQLEQRLRDRLRKAFLLGRREVASRCDANGMRADLMRPALGDVRAADVWEACREMPMMSLQEVNLLTLCSGCTEADAIGVLRFAQCLASAFEPSELAARIARQDWHHRPFAMGV
eukprot:2289744-Amphidinium_carterae.1